MGSKLGRCLGCLSLGTRFQDIHLVPPAPAVQVDTCKLYLLLAIKQYVLYVDCSDPYAQLQCSYIATNRAAFLIHPVICSIESPPFFVFFSLKGQ